jgi:hypothetical protein
MSMSGSSPIGTCPPGTDGPASAPVEAGGVEFEQAASMASVKTVINRDRKGWFLMTP